MKTKDYKSISLIRRPWDIFFLFFMILNLFFTIWIDFDSLVIENPANFKYPIWPPKVIIDIAHWYGKKFDPLLIGRPVWWRATIWLEFILFVPYYLAAMYAFIKGKEWIRIPTFIYTGIISANVIIILMEEMIGTYITPTPLMVWIFYLPWIVVPILMTIRMWVQKHPFLEKVKLKKA